MPQLKPLKKLVSKARNLRDSHQERHRPTGFGFALADSIDYLDSGHWNAVVQDKSLFLSQPYLRVLEQAGPDNLRQRYALIFKLNVSAVNTQALFWDRGRPARLRAAYASTKSYGQRNLGGRDARGPTKTLALKL